MGGSAPGCDLFLPPPVLGLHQPGRSGPRGRRGRARWPCQSRRTIFPGASPSWATGFISEVGGECDEAKRHPFGISLEGRAGVCPRRRAHPRQSHLQVLGNTLTVTQATDSLHGRVQAQDTQPNSPGVRFLTFGSA